MLKDKLQFLNILKFLSCIPIMVDLIEWSLIYFVIGAISYLLIEIPIGNKLNRYLNSKFTEDQNKNFNSLLW